MLEGKNIFNAFKKTWIVGGIILMSAVLYSYIKIQIAYGHGDSAKTLFFAAGLYAFIIYFITTLILILLREIIKRMKELKVYEKATGIKGIVRRPYGRTPRK